MGKFQLELYTRPTCSDCQAGKEFLYKNDISYIDYDLTKHQSKEDELIKITGTRIVPAFVFKNKSLLGWMNKPKVLIGFEQNIDEIRKILNIDS
ncbi:glutaredoxin family protein [Cytobacillus purgationiresistens]|uniref:Glutaredoxin 3 n=1 Tax=Cytobacillus purgationiresistens TaxID=863449 RepID=A0ABU0ALN4_9BACI|nr:glutaredoxin family protein [Cytobacillus purgationiresistens]MDQ0272174.1 glutaredoxin 3 [Cytobacillus purgationiresistens]